MSWYFRRPPAILKRLFPAIIWNGSSDRKVLYLTFDDGPNPATTPEILKILSDKKVKATFFCLGQQIESNIDLAKELIGQGHSLANHGFHHENGWKTKSSQYVAEVDKGQETLNGIGVSSNYFRPPYGRLKWAQFRGVSKTNQLVMWSLMTGDFDAKLSSKTCLEKTIQQTRNGDIVVFHDNEISFNKVKYVLPRYIDYCMSQGYEFRLINEC